MQFFKRNPFGHILFVKKVDYQNFGAYSHRRYRGFNELKIEGSEIIRDLEDSNVYLFPIIRHILLTLLLCFTYLTQV